MTPTLKKRFVLRHPAGLHARPVTNLVKIANAFDAKLQLICKDEAVDLKSIMGVLSLGVPAGTEVFIKASGHDAEAALAKITDFFNQLQTTK